MNIDIDFLKGVRDLIDWAQKKGTSTIKYLDRKKLNDIINSITDLVTNKKIYLNRINSAIRSGNQEQVELEIKKALNIAQNDTRNLLIEIKDSQLKDSTIYHILNSKASVLANAKLSEVERLKSLTGEGEINENIAETLSKYEEQWDHIRIELEHLKKNYNQP